MARSKNNGGQEVNAGSMADIAFLLLIFFLVTTQIATNKGLTMVLPPNEELPDVPINERNLFKIQLNSADKVLVEDEPLEDISLIREMVYDFVLNFGVLSDEKRGKYKVSDREVYNSLPVKMKNYIASNLGSKDSSEGPSKAIVSIKTDRGSSYELYIAVMDELNAAYYRIYSERVGLTMEQYRKLNRNDPRQRGLYEKGKRGINKGISLAEPTGNAG